MKDDFVADGGELIKAEESTGGTEEAKGRQSVG